MGGGDNPKKLILFTKRDMIPIKCNRIPSVNKVLWFIVVLSSLHFLNLRDKTIHMLNPHVFCSIKILIMYFKYTAVFFVIHLEINRTLYVFGFNANKLPYTRSYWLLDQCSAAPRFKLSYLAQKVLIDTQKVLKRYSCKIVLTFMPNYFIT